MHDIQIYAVTLCEKRPFVDKYSQKYKKQDCYGYPKNIRAREAGHI